MTPIYAEKGDTFFTRSNTLLGRLIRWGETDVNEQKGSVWTNHTGVVVENGWIGNPNTLAVPAIVVEALWKTRKGPLAVNGTLVRVFRPVPAYTGGELVRFVAEAESYIGDKYGWWKLVTLLVDRLIFKGRKVLSTLHFIKGRPICSFLAAGTNDEARPISESWLGFGTPWNAADPDTMLRFCESHPECWKEITFSGGSGRG